MSELWFLPHSRHAAHYKNHSVNSLCGNDLSLFGKVFRIHQYTVLQDAYHFGYSMSGTYTYHRDLKV